MTDNICLVDIDWYTSGENSACLQDNHLATEPASRLFLGPEPLIKPAVDTVLDAMRHLPESTTNTARKLRIHAVASILRVNGALAGIMDDVDIETKGLQGERAELLDMSLDLVDIFTSLGLVTGTQPAPCAAACALLAYEGLKKQAFKHDAMISRLGTVLHCTNSTIKKRIAEFRKALVLLARRLPWNERVTVYTLPVHTADIIKFKDAVVAAETGAVMSNAIPVGTYAKDWDTDKTSPLHYTSPALQPHAYSKSQIARFISEKALAAAQQNVLGVVVNKKPVTRVDIDQGPMPSVLQKCPVRLKRRVEDGIANLLPVFESALSLGISYTRLANS